ncbi:MAG: M56 family metallopeptidase [Planctomycetota bacterium]
MSEERILTLFDFGFETAVDLSLLVLAVLLVQQLCARWLTTRWRYALWFLVIARLMMPTVPQFQGGSLFDWRPTPTVTATPELPVQPNPGLASIQVKRSDGKGKTATGSAALADPSAPDGSATPAQPHPSSRADAPQGPAVQPILPAQDVQTPVSTSLAAEQGDSGPTSWAWRSWILLIWTAGIALSLAHLLLQEMRFRRRLHRDAIPLQSTRLHPLLQEAATSLHVRRLPQVLETSLVSSPALCGWLRPKLLMPRGHWDALATDELRFVLLHELGHQRRHDVALNALLQILQAVHWYHPLVRYAFHRLRLDQENLRDWEAMACLRPAAPRAGASALLKLAQVPISRPQSTQMVGILPRPSAIRQRIEMIFAFQKNHTSSRFLGATLLLTLGWAGLTEAHTQEPTDGNPNAERLPVLGHLFEGRSVTVSRQDPVPTWKEGLEIKLQTPITMDLEDEDIDRVIDVLRRETGINYVLRQVIFDDNPEITLKVSDYPAHRLLDLLCAQTGYAYVLHRNAVVLGNPYEMSFAHDQRFYNISELMPTKGESGWAEEYHHERLVEMVMNQVAPESWEYSGATIRVWNNMLLVDQSDAVHTELESFLNFLLNRGEEPQVPEEPWVKTLRAKLAMKVDVKLEDMMLAEALDTLSRAYGLPLVVREDNGWDDVSALKLEQAPLGEVLAWLAEAHDMQIVQEDGFLLFTVEPRMELRAFEILDLLDEGVEGDWQIEELQDLVRNSIGEYAWEYGWPSIETWNGLLLVRQSKGHLDHIDRFLAAMRKAM